MKKILFCSFSLLMISKSYAMQPTSPSQAPHQPGQVMVLQMVDGEGIPIPPTFSRAPSPRPSQVPGRQTSPDTFVSTMVSSPTPFSMRSQYLGPSSIVSSSSFSSSESGPFSPRAEGLSTTSLLFQITTLQEQLKAVEENARMTQMQNQMIFERLFGVLSSMPKGGRSCCGGDMGMVMDDFLTDLVKVGAGISQGVSPGSDLSRGLGAAASMLTSKSPRRK
jgi:hypothetical protein